MTGVAVLRPKGNWADVIDAMNAPAATDEDWADKIIDAAKCVFAAPQIGLYALRVPTDESAPSFPLWRPSSWGPLADDLMSFAEKEGREVWAPFHFSAPVLTYREGQRLFADEHMRDKMKRFEQRHSYGDGVAVVAHPKPGIVVVMHAIYDHPVELRAHERRLLTRIGLHLDAAYRLHSSPETTVAEISARGAVERLPRAPEAERLKAHVKSMRHAHQRGDPAVWTALVEGRVSVVARGDRFLVLENAPSAHGLRALTEAEASVVSMAARGLSTKMIAYGLGISPSVVSQRLGRAAAKAGLFSRTELLRLATLLTRDSRSSLAEDLLSDAEREIYLLVQRGLSNRAIANLRSRSLRTIANQVASILRKTKSRSRRSLLTT